MTQLTGSRVRPGALTASRVWHGLLAAVIAAALVIQIVLLARGGQDANSGAAGEVSFGTSMVRLFSFFTIESNLIVLAAAIVLCIDPVRDGRFWRVVRLDSLLAIVITGIVFETVLADLVHSTGWAQVANLGFHYVSPWMAFVGWLLFGPRPRITWTVVAWAFVWPIAWIVYTFVRGAIVRWYPYPFLDVDKHGFGKALGNTSLVLVLGIVLAVIFRYADRLPTLLGPSREDA
jgi:hypothetical protein